MCRTEQYFFQDNGTEQPTGPPSGQKENTAELHGGEKYSVEGEVKDSAQLTEADLMYLFELVETAQLAEDSYIPLRATTPKFLIDVVYEHSKGKVVVKDLPMASKVRHVAQNMEEDDGSSYGDERPHGFDKNDIVTISKEMGHPSYITLQENGRYAEVVSFYNSRRKRVIVAISFADDKNNYKYAQYMNGYNEGYYNIIVTQYEPDNFKSYLDSCEIVYDKQKMNGKYQVGSGRVVTFTHDTPFANTVSNNVADVKQQIQAVLDKVSPNHAAQMESYTENSDSNPELAQKLYDGLIDGIYADQFKEYLRLNDELERLEEALNSQNEGAEESYTEHASFDDTDQEYMDAVNEGDMDTAQRMVDAAAAGW